MRLKWCRAEQHCHHRSHFGSRYKSGCCVYAGLFYCCAASRRKTSGRRLLFCGKRRLLFVPVPRPVAFCGFLRQSSGLASYPSAAERGQAPPGAAKRGQAQPSAAKRSQAQSSAAKRSQAQPKRSQAQPSAAKFGKLFSSLWPISAAPPRSSSQAFWARRMV